MYLNLFTVVLWTFVHTQNLTPPQSARTLPCRPRILRTCHNSCSSRSPSPSQSTATTGSKPSPSASPSWAEAEEQLQLWFFFVMTVVCPEVLWPCDLLCYRLSFLAYFCVSTSCFIYSVTIYSSELSSIVSLVFPPSAQIISMDLADMRLPMFISFTQSTGDYRKL